MEETATDKLFTFLENNTGERSLTARDGWKSGEILPAKIKQLNEGSLDSVMTQLQLLASDENPEAQALQQQLKDVLGGDAMPSTKQNMTSAEYNKRLKQMDELLNAKKTEMQQAKEFVDVPLDDPGPLEPPPPGPESPPREPEPAPSGPGIYDEEAEERALEASHGVSPNTLRMLSTSYSEAEKATLRAFMSPEGYQAIESELEMTRITLNRYDGSPARSETLSSVFSDNDLGLGDLGPTEYTSLTTDDLLPERMAYYQESFFRRIMRRPAFRTALKGILGTATISAVIAGTYALGTRPKPPPDGNDPDDPDDPDEPQEPQEPQGPDIPPENFNFEAEDNQGRPRFIRVIKNALYTYGGKLIGVLGAGLTLSGDYIQKAGKNILKIIGDYKDLVKGYLAYKIAQYATSPQGTAILLASAVLIGIYLFRKNKIN